MTFKCKHCGELDSIVEVSVVPRVFRGIEPDGEGGIDYMNGHDEAFWEAETNLGFACDNESCDYWQGNYGTPALTDGSDTERPVFEWAWKLDEIAEIIEETA